MTIVKYNTGMAVGAIIGLIAAYMLNKYWHNIYLEIAYMIVGPALMWLGLCAGKYIQKRLCSKES
ncbi:MAG TPA: hypothetical protein DCL44_02585 [Elusimicrobia bacterium]|nr:hypothetical protein [Elusimicrobiota bacterium]